jgi:hypothetical protein
MSDPKDFAKSRCIPDVASAVAKVSQQQGGTVRSVRSLGPDKKVGGLGAAGLYNTESRYGDSSEDDPKRSHASGDTFHNYHYDSPLDW